MQAKIAQHPSSCSVDSYAGFAGLPPLVGLQTMSEATTTGLTVSESVARLKRIHWSLRKLHRYLHIAHYQHADLRAEDGI